jgi:peptidoglycan/xylan/chitin deacetylase (PgdA/CDA1 family)
LLQPSGWLWLLGAIAANHLFLGAVGMWPRSRLLGPNLVRLPPSRPGSGAVALSFDDGPDPDVTPRIMDLLERHGATASFFCVGHRAERWPDIVRDIARRGHSVENHTQRHPYAFACFGMRGLRREIATAQATLSRIAGRAPRFFRAPAGLRSPLLDPVLSQAGLRLTSWSCRGHDCVRRDPEAVLRQITSRLRDGDIVLMHDGSCARMRDGTPVVLAVLPRLLDHLRDCGLRAMSLPRALAAEPSGRIGGET